jgi:hypothetical protein
MIKKHPSNRRERLEHRLKHETKERGVRSARTAAGVDHDPSELEMGELAQEPMA